MYNKIARGYATSLMNKHAHVDNLGKWASSDRPAKLREQLSMSARSKNAERPLKRITALLKPAFNRPIVIEWEKFSKDLYAQSYYLARDVSVHASSENPSHGFVEDEILHTALDIIVSRHEIDLRLVVASSITRHALTRLLERDACTAGELNGVMKEALDAAKMICGSIRRTGSYIDGTYSFLVPYRGGALVIHNYPLKTTSYGLNLMGETGSIRTWLSPAMITKEMRDRMVEWDLHFTDHQEANVGAFDDLVRRNSRVLERDVDTRLPVRFAA